MNFKLKIGNKCIAHVLRRLVLCCLLICCDSAVKEFDVTIVLFDCCLLDVTVVNLCVIIWLLLSC